MRLVHIVAGLALATAMATPTPATAAAPQPCAGVKQITDTNDGHHNGTDLRAGWFSEANGKLQAVIEVAFGAWEPQHDDDTAVAGYALTWEVGGVRRYVRVEAPKPGRGEVRFDHGTWTRAAGFVSAGTTSAELISGAGGTATIDVPAAAGGPAGTVLARPLALTYDGTPTNEPHWVDRAPGGETPDGTEYGADFVVGTCGGPGPIDPSPGLPPITTTAVALSAPKTITGGGTRTVTGRVFPARGGVAVALQATAARTTTRRLTTTADGSFSARIAIGETTRLRAVAEGLSSQTLTTTVRSVVTMTVRGLRGGGSLITGRVRPNLPGRVLLLRTTSPVPTKRVTPRKGAFRMRLRHPRPGRYQVVFVPTGDRAERSTSKTGVIR